MWDRGDVRFTESHGTNRRHPPHIGNCVPKSPEPWRAFIDMPDPPKWMDPVKQQQTAMSLIVRGNAMPYSINPRSWKYMLFVVISEKSRRHSLFARGVYIHVPLRCCPALSFTILFSQSRLLFGNTPISTNGCDKQRAPKGPTTSLLCMGVMAKYQSGIWLLLQRMDILRP